MYNVSGVNCCAIFVCPSNAFIFLTVAFVTVAFITVAFITVGGLILNAALTLPILNSIQMEAVIWLH